jgi:tryptophanyl-tRNA synthetase
MDTSLETRDASKTSITTPSLTITGDTSQDINPWSVTGAMVDGELQAINYNYLVESFGTRLLTDDILSRFKRVTGHEPHVFMRRGLVFSHRDLETILDRHEKGLPFFLYTGRGPSSDSMHLGHMVPFTFTK